MGGYVLQNAITVELWVCLALVLIGLISGGMAIVFCNSDVLVRGFFIASVASLVACIGLMASIAIKGNETSRFDDHYKISQLQTYDGKGLEINSLMKTDSMVTFVDSKGNPVEGRLKADGKTVKLLVHPGEAKPGSKTSYVEWNGKMSDTRLTSYTDARN